jgi:hypothetical protein
MNEWIKVSNKLPTKGGKYLVYDKECSEPGSESEGLFTAYWRNNRFEHEWGDEIERVDYWMDIELPNRLKGAIVLAVAAWPN